MDIILGNIILILILFVGLTKYKCINCNCSIDGFDDVWDHVNGFSHTMIISNPKKCIIDSEKNQIVKYSEDEYLFMVNCSGGEFYNFLFIWK